MTHWHDSPQFDSHVEERVQNLRAKDEDEASHVCSHFPSIKRDDQLYFMRERSGDTWFLCHACCVRNVTLELLCLDEPPASTGAADVSNGQ